MMINQKTQKGEEKRIALKLEFKWPDTFAEQIARDSCPLQYENGGGVFADFQSGIMLCYLRPLAGFNST